MTTAVATSSRADKQATDTKPLTLRAVLYLRVSTTRQVKKDEKDPEGYSIPAQRDAGLRKARELGAKVVAEFIDYGESARTDDRPEFQRMLRFLSTQHNVRYVIVDKVNRFARNRRDDANALFEIQRAGAALISAKENIDDTPVGGLVHGILAAIAEYESRNNGTEAVKGMTQKAKGGGTPGRPPIGYRNVTRQTEDRVIKTVEIDPDRAPLIQWAFETYASGEWTISSLHEALVEKGLRCRPNGRGSGGNPIPRAHVGRILNNRYYLGKVIFQGVEYRGDHQPLVSTQVFDRVQGLLRSRNRAGERQRIHHHYLKGSVFCARCGSRLCLTQVTGRHGGKYLYFFCLNRHKGSECQQRYVLASKVEAAVERFYASNVRMPKAVQATIRAGLETEIERQRQHAGPEMKHQRARLKRLEIERERLAEGAITGAVPMDIAAKQQTRIEQELADAHNVLAASQAVFARIQEGLDIALKLLDCWDRVYLSGGPQIRRHCNQALFVKLLVVDGEVVDAEYRHPWGTLTAREFIEQMRRNTKNPGPLSEARGLNKVVLAGQEGQLSNPAGGLNMGVLARPEGFEPPTYRIEADCSVQLSYGRKRPSIAGAWCAVLDPATIGAAAVAAHGGRSSVG